MRKGRLTGLLIILILTISTVLFLIIREGDITINIKILVISIAISVVLVFYLTGEIRTIRERRRGIPTEDEMSYRQKEKAGNRAFHSSLLLWLLLFIFKSYFEQVETLLGIGILGSALLYGIYLWQFKLKGTNNE